MSMPNEIGFHVPQPSFRSGSTIFENLQIPPAGLVVRPPVDEAADQMRDHAYQLIRVLDDEGAAVGDWRPSIVADDLRKGLRSMMITRAYDTRMVRAQR